MADYRAKNRNTKAVDVARVRAAAKFSTPAPKVNPNVVAQKPKVSAKYSAALREQAQRGVAGARGGSYFDRSQYGSEAIFDPATGVSGAVGLATTDYNPEGIKYATRMVPAGARGGGMVSGGQPNIGSSFSGILEAIKGMATPPPTTEFDAAMQDKYKNNPRAVGAAQQRLSPEDQYQMTNQRENAKREIEYSNLLRTLKAAGLTEEELYRSAVVSPDGKINLNPNAQAAISQLGNAADSLRLLDLAGMGAGKAAGVGARAVGRTVGRAVEDIAVRGLPIPVPVGVGGVPIMRVGGSANKAAREAAALRAAEDELSLAPEDQLPIGALEELQGNRRPIMPGSPEARIVDEAKNATPKNIDALLPTKRNANGDYDAVEINAQDEASGLTTFDPSELRLLTLGGTGAYGKFGPLAKLSDLTIHKTATKIRAIYTPPPAEEILRLMNRTDQAVATRPNVKPGTWVRNTYTIEDAQVLLDRWKTAASEFEKANGRPLPWRLEADVPNPKKGGKIEVKRIFGQDVEHAIPVNQGGKGTVDELVLLPSIGNSGKRDFAWEDYAKNNPYNWNAYLESFYGDIKKF